MTNCGALTNTDVTLMKLRRPNSFSPSGPSQTTPSLLHKNDRAQSEPISSAIFCKGSSGNDAETLLSSSLSGIAPYSSSNAKVCCTTTCQGSAGASTRSTQPLFHNDMIASVVSSDVSLVA